MKFFIKKSLVVFIAMLTASVTLKGADVEGVGILLFKNKDDPEPRITQVFERSSAEKAGIHPNCFLVSIDGISTRNKTLADCIRMVRGPSGTKVILELTDIDHTSTNKLNLTRTNIHLNLPNQNIPTNSPFQVPRLSKIETNLPIR
jgi:C-terminal processing protease CtpA/Prc